MFTIGTIRLSARRYVRRVCASVAALVYRGHEMISINEAVKQGITCVRMPRWAFSEDHLEISIIDGRLGPWARLWSPGNEVIGQDNPQDILWIGQDNDSRVYEPYEGPLPNGDTGND